MHFSLLIFICDNPLYIHCSNESTLSLRIHFYLPETVASSSYWVQSNMNKVQNVMHFDSDVSVKCGTNSSVNSVDVFDFKNTVS